MVLHYNDLVDFIIDMKAFDFKTLKRNRITQNSYFI